MTVPRLLLTLSPALFTACAPTPRAVYEEAVSCAADGLTLVDTLAAWSRVPDVRAATAALRADMVRAGRRAGRDAAAIDDELRGVVARRRGELASASPDEVHDRLGHLRGCLARLPR